MGKERVGQTETVALTHICAKQLANRKQLQGTGNSAWCSVVTCGAGMG